MKYIEARPGVNIAKHKIISVESVDEMTCRIGTDIGMFESVYPSWRILMLLEQPDIEETIAKQPESPASRINLWGAQHFAG